MRAEEVVFKFIKSDRVFFDKFLVVEVVRKQIMAHTDDECGVGIWTYDDIFTAVVACGVVYHDVYAIGFGAGFFELLHAYVAVVSRRD